MCLLTWRFLNMKHSLWRKCAIGVLTVALVNTGMMSAASAAIVDTSEIVTTDRAADLASVRAHLDRAEVLRRWSRWVSMRRP
jgi:hypothetical protein